MYINNIEALFIALCGFYVCASLHHTLIFLGRRIERYNLYYGVFSLLFALYIFSEKTQIIFNLFDNPGAVDLLGYGALYLMFPLFIAFFEDISSNKTMPPTKIFFVLGLLLSVIQFFVNSHNANNIFLIWKYTALFIFIPYFIIYVVIYSILGAARKNAGKFFNEKTESDFFPENEDKIKRFPAMAPDFIKLEIKEIFSTAQGMLLLPALIMMFSFARYISYSVFINSGVRLSMYGFFIFTACASILLAKKFSDLNKIARNTTNELKHQTEIAGKALNAKSEFIATMSHEIRTPLNAILGLSEIELQKDLPQDYLNTILNIKNSGEDLLSLVDTVLDIAKIETKTLETSLANYDTAYLINDTIQTNMRHINSKPIVFKISIPDDMPSILCGDRMRIKQVLDNLLSNAFKWTEEGSVTFDIKFIKLPMSFWLSFSVTDTGIGIREENIDEIFTKYSQIDTKANRKNEGAGFGLAVSKHLAVIMEGTINVQSEFGKGSTFEFVLPQKVTDTKPLGRKIINSLIALQPIDKKTLPDGLIRSYFPEGRILIVDDVPTNLAVAKGFLKPYGLSVDCLSSGSDAVEAIRSADIVYDLVLMDYMMPQMDGLEAVRIIRNIGTVYAANVPVIALTANITKEAKHKFLSNGFNGVLTKPVDILKLDTILNRYIHIKDGGIMNAGAFAGNETAGVIEDERMELFRQINPVDGIEINDAVNMFNNVSSYLEVIKVYVSGTETFLDKLKEQLTNGIDAKEYAMIMHGIKGSSYSICAKELGDMAVKLENYSVTGDIEAIKHETPMFIAVANKLLAGLTVFININQGTQKELMRPSPDKKLLSDMVIACKNYKISDIDKILTELEEYQYENDNDLILWLHDQVNNAEFEKIIMRLEKKENHETADFR
ncbi:hypothetical protein FACS1894190_09130 [Spirochaetia bacterium]|nr:hypothetical protein FACS1894190_09130 [Spirochaetia bacterium]